MNVAFSCEACKFAEMVEGDQVDCTLNMLDRYEERGFVVDNVETDHGTFKIIEKKMNCKMFAGPDESLEGDELFLKLQKENQLEVGVVLFVKPDDSYDITNLFSAVEYAQQIYKESTHTPAHFYFVDISNKHIPLHNILNRAEVPFKYTVCSPFLFENNKEAAIDQCKGYFHTKHIYVVGDLYDFQFLGKMNSIMWDGVEDYILAYDSFGGYLTTSLAFFQWNGNSEEVFEFEDESKLPVTLVKYTDKVEFFAKQNGQEKFIYKELHDNKIE